jgi:hypothetical protein
VIFAELEWQEVSSFFNNPDLFPAAQDYPDIVSMSGFFFCYNLPAVAAWRDNLIGVTFPV